MSDHPSSGKRRATPPQRKATSATPAAGAAAGPRKRTQGPAPRTAAGPGQPGGPGRTGRGSGGPAGPGKPRWKRWAWRITKWGTAVGLVLALIVVGLSIYLYRSTDIPDPNHDFQTQTTYVYYNGGKTQIGRFAEQNRTSISYNEMPENIKDAVVAAENRTFWTDKGIDPKGIIRAAFSNARGNATQGASTITQQYVKILYLNQERSYQRKIKEAILSLKIQRTMSKQQILEGYLNTIYFGRGAYGIEAASEAYFGVHAKDLNLRQAAVLASVLNNPYGLDPANGASARENLAERYRYVLDGIADVSAKVDDPSTQISDAAAAKAAKRLPPFPKIKASDTYGGQRGHALSLVKSELLKLGFTPEQIEGGGLRVTTTLTKKAMDAAEQGVKEAEPDGFSDKNLHVAVASVQPDNGALRGFYGGQDYLRSQINWAATGGSIGSTMKPVTLTTGLEAGFSLKDTFDGDSPYVYPNGEEVHNEGEESGIPDGTDYGRVTATHAMEESINTAFIDMTESIPDGAQKIYRNALKMGIPPTKADKADPGIPATSRDLEPTDSRITLGKAIVSPINIANTYATIANGGVRSNVHIVDKVEDSNGTVLYRYNAADNRSRAMSEDIADDVSYALQETVKNGTGQAALSLGRPAAGKTGTATDDKGNVISAWFTGYTPQLATSVMYVRGNGRGALNDWLPSYFGADYPARTWTAVMERDMDGVDVEDFPPPANVDGDAPDDNHEPLPSFVPPPPKKSTAPEKPKHSATPPPPEHTHPPHPTKSPSPSTQPTEPSAPTSTCAAFVCPPGNGNGHGGSPSSSPSSGASPGTTDGGG